MHQVDDSFFVDGVNFRVKNFENFVSKVNGFVLFSSEVSNQNWDLNERVRVFEVGVENADLGIAHGGVQVAHGFHERRQVEGVVPNAEFHLKQKVILRELV